LVEFKLVKKKCRSKRIRFLGDCFWAKLSMNLWKALFFKVQQKEKRLYTVLPGTLTQLTQTHPFSLICCFSSSFFLPSIFPSIFPNNNLTGDHLSILIFSQAIFTFF